MVYTEPRRLCLLSCDIGCYFTSRVALSRPGPSHPHSGTCPTTIPCMRIFVETSLPPHSNPLNPNGDNESPSGTSFGSTDALSGKYIRCMVLSTVPASVRVLSTVPASVGLHRSPNQYSGPSRPVQYHEHGAYPRGAHPGLWGFWTRDRSQSCPVPVQ